MIEGNNSRAVEVTHEVQGLTPDVTTRRFTGEHGIQIDM